MTTDQYMNKTLRLKLAAASIVVVGLAGCTTTTTPTTATPVHAVTPTTVAPTPTTAAPTTTTAAPKSLKVGDKAIGTHGSLQVLSYVQPIPPTDNQFAQPRPGFEFAAVEVEGCVTSGPPVSLNPVYVTLKMADNTRLTFGSIGATMSATPLLSSDKIAAGDCTRGKVGFEVPKGQRPVAVYIDTMKWAVA